MNKLILIVELVVILTSCEINNEQSKHRIVDKKNEVNYFLNDDLNGIIDQYICNLSYQHDTIKKNRLITIHFEVIDSDTIMFISSKKYLGEFKLDSKLFWKYLFEKDGYTIFIGDTDENLGAKLYDTTKFVRYKSKSEYHTNMPNIEQDFAGRNWKFGIVNNSVITKAKEIHDLCE